MTTTTDESGLVAYARRELQLAGMFDPDADYGPNLAISILEVVATFARYGHSGYSAAISLEALKKLLAYEPLTALTYAEDEWIDQSNLNGGEPLWQNSRRFDVFSIDRGATWYSADGTSGVRP